MKILVTGGAGYIGSHVCKLLRLKSIDHLVYDDFSTGHRQYVLTSPYIDGDIVDEASLERCFTHFKPETVIHLAAAATLPQCEADSARAAAVNIEGTRSLLEAMRRHEVRNIIFASSCAVYDAPTLSKPLGENDSLQPASVYGRTKQEAERLLARYHTDHGIGYAALRLFNVAGADSESEIGEAHACETHLLPLAIEAACGGSPLQLYGNDYSTPDGTAVRDYVHVWDVAEALLSAAIRVSSKAGAITVNIGSGIPTSVLQLIHAVEHCSGKRVPYVMSPRRPGDTPYLLSNVTQMKKLFIPRFSELSVIVKDAYAWHQRNA